VFLVFQHTLESVCLGAEAPVSFVFDRQDQFRGRAVEIYNSICTKSDLAFRDKLGGLDFQDKDKLRPLQLADYVAYEFYRHTVDVRFRIDRTDRWQWSRISSSLIRERCFSGKRLETLLKLYEG